MHNETWSVILDQLHFNAFYFNDSQIQLNVSNVSKIEMSLKL